MRLLLFNLCTDVDDPVLGFTTDWINAIARRCERVVVVTMRVGRIGVDANVSVHSVGLEMGRSRPLRALTFYRILARVLREEHFDVCFAHMIPLFAVMAWPLLKARGVPIVLWYAHGHVSWMLRLAMRLVDRGVTSSRSGLRIATPKLAVVGQGIDTHRFCPRARADSPHFVLLNIGRISRVKRLETIIELLARVPERTPEGAIVVARLVGSPVSRGDRNYQDGLLALAQKLGVAPRVEFVPAIGYRAIEQIYSHADLFISPSATGSLDKVVLEAMSSGVPVLTSNPAYLEVLDGELRRRHCVSSQALADWQAQVLFWIAAGRPARDQAGNALRAWVIREHSLDSLSAKLFGEFVRLRQLTSALSRTR